MKPLSSPTRALRLGVLLYLTVVLAACGGGKAAVPAADQVAVTPKTPVIRCAP
jgi:hypothetical protein